MLCVCFLDPPLPTALGSDLHPSSPRPRGLEHSWENPGHIGNEKQDFQEPAAAAAAARAKEPEHLIRGKLPGVTGQVRNVLLVGKEPPRSKIYHLS